MYQFSKAITIQVIIVLCTFLCFGSCTNQSEENSTEKRKIFRYNQPSTVNSLDPAFAKDQGTIWIANQLFNTLVTLDDDLKLQPSVAHSFEVDETGKTYTFHLNQNIKFHRDDNVFKNETDRKLTSYDVKYSFERLIDPNVASPGSWIFMDRIALEPFIALNDSTFILQLKEPFSPILNILTMQYCSIVSRSASKTYGKEFRSHPIGTGPFEFMKWSENEVLLLTKNSDYWERDEDEIHYPYLDGIRIEFNENKKTAALDFVDGKLDFLSGIDPAYRDIFFSNQGKLLSELGDTYKVERIPYLNSEYIAFNEKLVQGTPYGNKLVRQAIHLGIDKESIIQHLRFNVGIPANTGFCPTGMVEQKGMLKCEYNREKAKELLTKAGYPNGEGIDEITLETTASYKDICTSIQSQLSELGIPVKLELMPSSYLRERMSKGESAFFRGSWLADYPDAENFLSVFYGDFPAPPNYTRFNNNNYNEKYIASVSESDHQLRQNNFKDMEEILQDEAIVIPLFYDEVIRISHKNIEGLAPNAMNLLHVKKVKKF